MIMARIKFFNVGKNNPNYKHGKYIRKQKNCIDCGKKLKYYKAIRCWNCYNNWRKGKKRGRFTPIPTCIDCNKEISSRQAKRCYKCDRKLRIKEHKCIDCGIKICRSSQRCHSCSKKGKRNPNFGKPPKHGKICVYKGNKMRSTWEMLFAKYLDKNKIKWLYEPKTFDLDSTVYTPDFYLPETNTYIEIKGYWRKKAKNRFNLFKKKYSNINIELLMQKDLIERGVLPL